VIDIKIWRRGWDLNPRYPLRYVRFRGGSFQPLTHLSASDELFNCGVLRKPRSGFRQRAPASLTPAKRLNFRGGSFQPLTHLSASDELFNCEVLRKPRSGFRQRAPASLTPANRLKLAAVSKERLHHLRTTARQNTAADLHLMVQLRMIDHLHDGMHRACFGIVGTVDQTPDSRMH
jgi:hypothetical protein